ncbi:hypothetical protein G6F42_029120 [Rhizopus arrhizus]|nr:hypothetical protein G6F42_029120 [Rhizopus arrhizus]
MTRASWLKNEQHSWQRPDLNAVSLPEEGYTLADIVSGARIKLDSIVSEVCIATEKREDNPVVIDNLYTTRSLSEVNELMIGGNSTMPT